jgi:GxxExxY protein
VTLALCGLGDDETREQRDNRLVRIRKASGALELHNQPTDLRLAPFSARELTAHTVQYCGAVTRLTLTASELNELTSTIIRCAIQVHRALGPGLLESAYLVCLCHEMMEAKLEVVTERRLSLVYKTVRLKCAYKADVIVNGSVLLEIKAVDAIAQIHLRQIATYLKLAHCPVGLLLNFGAQTMRDGIHRIVNDFPAV